MDSVSSGIAKELIHLNGRNFISSADFSSQQIKSLLELASQLKAGNRRIDLGNRLLGLIFKKASTRTRVSFQVSMARLGGQVVDLSIQSSQIGRGEPVKDTARVLKDLGISKVNSIENKATLEHKKAKLEHLKKLRDAIRKEIEQRDLPQNYLDGLTV